MHELLGEFHYHLGSRVHVHQVLDGGRARPLNVGLQRAAGRYVAFLDDDDLVTADWVEVFRRGALAKPGRVVRSVCVQQDVSSRSDDDPGYEVRSGFRSPYAPEFDFIHHLVMNQTPIHAFAVPRQTLDVLGIRFDESLPVLEDWDFLLQVVPVDRRGRHPGGHGRLPLVGGALGRRRRGPAPGLARHPRPAAATADVAAVAAVAGGDAPARRLGRGEPGQPAGAGGGRGHRSSRPPPAWPRSSARVSGGRPDRCAPAWPPAGRRPGPASTASPAASPAGCAATPEPVCPTSEPLIEVERSRRVAGARTAGGRRVTHHGRGLGATRRRTHGGPRGGPSRRGRGIRLARLACCAPGSAS